MGARSSGREGHGKQIGTPNRNPNPNPNRCSDDSGFEFGVGKGKTRIVTLSLKTMSDEQTGDRQVTEGGDRQVTDAIFVLY